MNKEARQLSLWYARKLNDYYIQLKKEYQQDPQKVLNQIQAVSDKEVQNLIKEARRN
jgi:hypothetical protein